MVYCPKIDKIVLLRGLIYLLHMNDLFRNKDLYLCTVVIVCAEENEILWLFFKISE